MTRSGHGIALVLLAAVSARAGAQQRVLRVISSDSVPVVYAYVTIEGGTGQITNEKGEINIGSVTGHRALSVNVRRIGYNQFFGKLDLSDTAKVVTIMLSRLAQSLGEVLVTDTTHASVPVNLKGFYDRWLMRQKGLLSATFIGPEEIEFRHPDKITNVLYGLNGVSFVLSAEGEQVAVGYSGQCQMAILIDGIRQCPGLGCKCDICGANIPQIGSRGAGAGGRPNDQTAVLIDRILSANDVAAIEVYPRGGNMPVSLQVSDQGCGVIAFWTGSRRP